MKPVKMNNGYWRNKIKYYKKRLSEDREPETVRSIVMIEDDLFIDIHTDILICDLKKGQVWKGDLV